MCLGQSEAPCLLIVRRIFKKCVHRMSGNVQSERAWMWMIGFCVATSSSCFQCTAQPSKHLACILTSAVPDGVTVRPIGAQIVVCPTIQRVRQHARQTSFTHSSVRDRPIVYGKDYALQRSREVRRTVYEVLYH